MARALLYKLKDSLAQDLEVRHRAAKELADFDRGSEPAKRDINAIERAFELARSGYFRTVGEVKYAIAHEGYDAQQRIDSSQIHAQLRKVISIRTAFHQTTSLTNGTGGGAGGMGRPSARRPLFEQGSRPQSSIKLIRTLFFPLFGECLGHG